MITSGVRIGTPALTTRGMGENEMIKIANWIGRLIDNPDSTSLIESIQKDVVSLCKEFPLYEDNHEMYELSA
jgi:glycine hydroxymethyltransferase